MRNLPTLMDSWLNAPLCSTVRYAEIAAAVFSGRLNIASVVNAEGNLLGRPELEAIAGQAKVDASAARAEPTNNLPWTIDAVDDISVIEVKGALTRTWGVRPYSGATGYDGILMQLEDSLNSPAIKGVWLDINSGGGTVDGLFDLVDLIYGFRSRNGGAKPIWGMAADYAYSAAYAIGSACDRLFVPPTGGVGSVGTITMHTSFARALDEEGIDVTIFRDPPLKAKATQFEQMDEGTAAHIQEQLRELTDRFQRVVARNMGISHKAVAETQGLDYIGSRAKAIGFVSDVLPESVAWEKFKRHLSRR